MLVALGDDALSVDWSGVWWALCNAVLSFFDVTSWAVSDFTLFIDKLVISRAASSFA